MPKDFKNTPIPQSCKTAVSKSVCNYCDNKLCDSQQFNAQCFKCGKKPIPTKLTEDE